VSIGLLAPELQIGAVAGIVQLRDKFFAEKELVRAQSAEVKINGGWAE